MPQASRTHNRRYAGPRTARFLYIQRFFKSWRRAMSLRATWCWTRATHALQRSTRPRSTGVSVVPATWSSERPSEAAVLARARAKVFQGFDHVSGTGACCRGRAGVALQWPALGGCPLPTMAEAIREVLTGNGGRLSRAAVREKIHRRYPGGRTDNIGDAEQGDAGSDRVRCCHRTDEERRNRRSNSSNVVGSAHRRAANAGRERLAHVGRVHRVRGGVEQARKSTAGTPRSQGIARVGVSVPKKRRAGEECPGSAFSSRD